MEIGREVIHMSPTSIPNGRRYRLTKAVLPVGDIQSPIELVYCPRPGQATSWWMPSTPQESEKEGRSPPISSPAGPNAQKLFDSLNAAIARIAGLEQRSPAGVLPTRGTVLSGWKAILAYLCRLGVPITRAQAIALVRKQGLPIDLRGQGAPPWALDDALADWVERLKVRLRVPSLPDESSLTEPERAANGESDGYDDGTTERAALDESTQPFGRRGIPSSPYSESGLHVKGKRLRRSS